MALSIDLTSDVTRAALSARSTMPEKPSLVGLTRAEMADALIASGIVS